MTLDCTRIATLIRHYSGVLPVRAHRVLPLRARRGERDGIAQSRIETPGLAAIAGRRECGAGCYYRGRVNRATAKLGIRQLSFGLTTGHLSERRPGLGRSPPRQLWSI